MEFTALEFQFAGECSFPPSPERDSTPNGWKRARSEAPSIPACRPAVTNSRSLPATRLVCGVEPGFRLPLVVQPFFWQTWWFRVLLLAAFTAGVIAVVRYISFRRLRREMVVLEQQAVLDKERTRIAKDLHDDLGASMTQMTLLLELAKHHHSEPDAVLNRLDDGLRAGREAIKSLDAAVWAINPANNTLPELVAYIGQFAMEFLQQANIRCHLDLPDHPPERLASAELRHNLFLIVKEALNNIVRHAGASEVRLQILITPGTLGLLIKDDGHGMSDALRRQLCGWFAQHAAEGRGNEGRV